MWAAIGPPRRHKTYSLCALFLSSFCRNTAVFFFCSSSNSRFNSLTIAISLAGSLSATASRQRSRQSFPGILGHDASQKRKRSLWPSSPPPLLCATSSGRQSRRASTYVQGNSRVDEPFRMEDKTRAIIQHAGERGTRETLCPPPYSVVRPLLFFRISRLPLCSP